MKQNKAKMKSLRVKYIAAIAIFISVFIIFMMTFIHYYPYAFGLKKWTLYASVEVSTDRGGFDLNSTALTFGIIKSGGAAKRWVNFTNEYDFPVMVKIIPKGNITELLAYESDIYVEPGELKRIEIRTASTPETPIGKYEGYITFKVVPAK